MLSIFLRKGVHNNEVDQEARQLRALGEPC